MRTVLVGIVVVATLAAGVITSKAQTDLPKVLVGKWEGEFSKVVKGQIDTQRTLVIGQVREQDGKWVVEGARYGVTGKKLDSVDVTLEVTGDQVRMEFDTPVGGCVKLQLSKGNILTGTYVRTVGFRTMELRKVE